MQLNKKHYDTLIGFGGSAASVTEVAQIAAAALTVASVYFENKKGFMIRDCTNPSDEEIALARAERDPGILSTHASKDALRMI
jgi:hypothetical protein